MTRQHALADDEVRGIIQEILELLDGQPYATCTGVLATALLIIELKYDTADAPAAMKRLAKNFEQAAKRAMNS